MRLEELDFEVAEGSIAQRPVEPRDSCRLMFVAARGGVRHGRFADLPTYLRPGDTLVLNDSRVLPARLHASKQSGGRVELLFLRPADDGMLVEAGPAGGDGAAGGRAPAADGPHGSVGEEWEVLARPSHRLRPGMVLTLPGGQTVTLRQMVGEGRWVAEGPIGVHMTELMEAYGKPPLPPYIKTYPDDPSSYQTVYAEALGSAAAPTAGLHFTPGLLGRLRLSRVGVTSVTLHVGLDTFQPIREAVVEEHRIHREAYSVAEGGLKMIRATLESGGRLVAVGTTAVRVLETLAARGVLEGPAAPGPISGSTDIFITPGHRFQAVHAMLTNFHLPRSTVLALVMAFAGVERIRGAYAEAAALGYRFFSFGDAMLLEAPAGREPCGRQGP